MISSTPLLLVLACTLSLGVLAQELDFSVSVVGNEVDIDIEELPNPCEGHQCPTGEECVSVVTPQLMQLPVAHCVQSNTNKKEESGPCVEYDVSSNLLNCKTEAEWKHVGNQQCILRDNQAPVLTKTMVQYACHSFVSSSASKFLSATFTCCTEDYLTKPEPDVRPSEPSDDPPEKENPSDDIEKPYRPKPPVHGTLPVQTDEDNSSGLHPYIVPMVLGAMLVIGFVAIILAIWQRQRSVRQRKSQKPRIVFATSFVNPNADHHQVETDWVVNPLDSTDKSLLIVNEHNTPSK